MLISGPVLTSDPYMVATNAHRFSSKCSNYSLNWYYSTRLGYGFSIVQIAEQYHNKSLRNLSALVALRGMI